MFMDILSPPCKILTPTGDIGKAQRRRVQVFFMKEARTWTFNVDKPARIIIRLLFVKLNQNINKY